MDRVNLVSNIEKIVIATSIDESDDIIFNYCITNNVNCYRGNLQDVSKRFLECAEYYNFDYAIRINGDNIFVDIETLRMMVNLCLSTNYKFISNVKGRSFPKGMSIEIVDVKYYHDKSVFFITPEFKEHVTSYFYENINMDEMYFVYNTITPELSGFQLAIDSEADFNFVSKIISRFDQDHISYGLKELGSIIKELL